MTCRNRSRGRWNCSSRSTETVSLQSLLLPAREGVFVYNHVNLTGNIVEYVLNMENPWSRYSERTKDKPPRELLVKAMEHVRERGRALDLGPGALNESKFLLEQGFRSVIAVNKDPLETDPVAKERAGSFPRDRFEYRVSTYDSFAFEMKAYDLINAQYALPFNPPETFDRMFESLTKSLKSGGMFTGQFFGPKDEWNDGTNAMTFLSREKVEELLRDFDIISFEEVEGSDRLAVGGEKYWHTFHVIARKR